MITDLKKELFNKCVMLHIKKGKPIGSKLLKKKFFKKLADSTLRLYLNRLVKERLLENVNDYAGRVPTDYGWRQFFEWNIDDVDLKREEVKLIEKINFNERMVYISKVYKVYYVVKEKDGHFVEGGLDNILKNKEFYKLEVLKGFAEFLNIVKMYFEKFMPLYDEDYALYIGGENPIKLEVTKDFSLIVKRSRNKLCYLITMKRFNYPYVIKLINKAL